MKSHSEVKNVTFLTLLAADKAFSASMATGTVRTDIQNILEILGFSREKYIPITRPEFMSSNCTLNHVMCCDQIFERILSWREFKIFKFSVSIVRVCRKWRALVGTSLVCFMGYGTKCLFWALGLYAKSRN